MINPGHLHTVQRRVVSCDPGTKALGIVSFGANQRLKLDTFQTTEKYNNGLLRRICNWADDFIRISSRNLAGYMPLFCIENCFYNRLNPNTAMIQSEVIGALIRSALEFNFEIIRLDNSRIKRLFAGIGSATKEQMWEAAKPYYEQKECSINYVRTKAERYALADAIGIGVVGYWLTEADDSKVTLFKE